MFSNFSLLELLNTYLINDLAKIVTEYYNISQHLITLEHGPRTDINISNIASTIAKQSNDSILVVDTLWTDDGYDTASNYVVIRSNKTILRTLMNVPHRYNAAGVFISTNPDFPHEFKFAQVFGPAFGNSYMKLHNFPCDRLLKFINNCLPFMRIYESKQCDGGNNNWEKFDEEFDMHNKGLFRIPYLDYFEVLKLIDQINYTLY